MVVVKEEKTGEQKIINNVCAYTAVNLRNYNLPGMFCKAAKFLPSAPEARSASV
jgi:hypothetical protein